jgi:hypothetical protein
MTQAKKPFWDAGIPWCVRECPWYLAGCAHKDLNNICIPTIRDMRVKLNATEGQP